MHVVDDSEMDAAYEAFARHVPLPLIALHFERGELNDAAAIARLALTMPDCPDAQQIEEILDRCSLPPDEWRSVLDEFLENPSVERWRELMRFVPDDLLYQRHRNGIRYLRKRGLQPDLLFLCACTGGLTEDAIELAEEGLVSVETIVARAADAGAARGAYIGLAAQVAFAAGDLIGAIRFLREAMTLENEWITVLPHVWWIRERASASEHEALDRAGIPRS